MEKWSTCLITSEPFEMVFPIKGKDDVFRPFLTRIVPVKNDEGTIVRWVGTKYRHHRFQKV